MKNLFRMLALAGMLSISSMASAYQNPWTDQGKCYIQCGNGTTASFWATSVDCCREFDNLCGGVGLAYTTYGSPPYQSIYECFAS